jgi:hypothetical protein
MTTKQFFTTSIVVLIIIALGLLFYQKSNIDDIVPETSIATTTPIIKDVLPQEIPAVIKPITKPTPKPVQGKCFIGGCSSHICSDKSDMVSTCEYREQYACYQTAKCERQSNGVCGWTQTAELKACLVS